tara:strand:+ start:273 stop:845 length:573 start_codon:yes stop_codon:yes gene_type:complete
MASLIDAVIYKLSIVGHEKLFYIGSSIEFENRVGQHKHCVKTSNAKVYKKIREHGGEFETEILYEFQCATDLEQRKVEQDYINKLEPPLNTKKAYCLASERIQYDKDWRDTNKEYHRKYHKEWREINKDYHKEWYKQNDKTTYKNYYEANKAELQKRVTCICGSTPTKENLIKHMRTNKHKKLLALLNSK